MVVVIITVIVLTAGHVLWVITLQSFHVEHIAERTAVWPGYSFNTNIELSTVGRVCMASVVTRLVHFRRIGTDKSFCYFCQRQGT